MFYSYKDTQEESYAEAINVPKNQCQGNPLNEHFLNLENATCVRNAIFNTENQFYKGEDLMAAGPYRCNCNESENCKSKSVSVLLQNDSSTTFKNWEPLWSTPSTRPVKRYQVDMKLYQTLKTWKITLEVKPFSSRKFIRLMKMTIVIILQKTLKRLWVMFPSIVLCIQLLCL